MCIILLRIQLISFVHRVFCLIFSILQFDISLAGGDLECKRVGIWNTHILILKE